MAALVITLVSSQVVKVDAILLTRREHVQAVDDLRSAAFTLLKTDPCALPDRGLPSLSVPVLTCAAQNGVRPADATLAEEKLKESESLILRNNENEKLIPIAEIQRIEDPVPHYWHCIETQTTEKTQGVIFKKTVEESHDTTWIHDGSPFVRVSTGNGRTIAIRWNYIESYGFSS